MLTHPLAPYFWLAYNLIVGCMLLWSTLLFFKEKVPLSRLIFISSIVGTLGGISAQLIMVLARHFGWVIFASGSSPEPMQLVIEICYALSILGHLGFHTGLLLYAMRLKQQSTRLADLEAIFRERERGPH
ncbi:hypothetical protein ACFQY0_03975 [Haloferula chungangensis]|uniref:Uncharacterized protein n=1 Tax=Haloferula chungangensis TaxID=1048331 RepID=A0ABW2L3N9_9BACT